MNKHFRRLSLVMAVMMVFVCSFTCVFADDSYTITGITDTDVVVLFTNDVHCAYENYPIVASYKNEVAKLAQKVILVDEGDAVQGGVVGTLSQGSYIVDCMNAVGYDIAIPGNHEFDYGMDRFFELANMQKAKFICSNFIDLRTNKPAFDGYTIITAGDKKIGFVAVDTPESIVKSTPTYFEDGNGNKIYDFNGDRLAATVQVSVDAALAEGADTIILLTHLGDDLASAPWTSAEIVAQLTGVDYVLDGHSHSTVPGTACKDKAGNEVIVAQTGTKLANIGQLVLHADGSANISLIDTTVYTDKDAAVLKVVDKITKENEALLNKVVAKSSINLTVNNDNGKRAVRSYETNLGDLCADAYRYVLDADVAFVNGGGVRADIASGDVTYGQIIAVHPFGNAGCVVEATGQEILDALEFASRGTPVEEIGGFLQVSGLTYTVDTTIPSTVKEDADKMFVSVEGARRVKDVIVGGEPIDPNKTYKLASHNYMLKDKGDGFTMFADNKILQDEVMLDNELLITYITKNLKGVIDETYAEPQGRILVTAPFADVASNNWAQVFVAYVAKNGLVNGTGNGKFTPKAEMTKEQFLTVLGRMDNVAAAAEGTYWATPYVEWAQANKICETEGFVGTDPITRNEMAEYTTNFYTHLGKGPVGAFAIKLDYTDLDDNSNMNALMFTKIKGFFQGYPDGSFGGDKTATRAEVAKVLTLIYQDLH